LPPVIAECLRAIGSHFDRLLRIHHRQAAQLHRIDQMKDGGVDADAECQRQDRHERERRAAPQHAGAMAEIGKENLEPWHAALITHRLDRRGHRSVALTTFSRHLHVGV
jgi:hypothetical protein